MYAKLFSRITESSLMEEPINVRYTFVLMLAIADPEGYVIGTDVAIARRLNMPLDEFQECLAVLMAPDPDSNSQELDGRRVTVSTGERGYHVVNFVAYRDLKDANGRREYMREYMRRYRERTGSCAYCGKQGNVGEDHITPTSAGGEDTQANKAPCCQTCNTSKKAYSLPRWLCQSDLVRSKATLAIALVNKNVSRIFYSQLALEEDVNFVKHCKTKLARLRQEEEEEDAEEEEEPPIVPQGDSAQNGKTPKNKPLYSEAFENFWIAGPKHKRRRKGTAWKAWQKSLNLIDAETLTAKAAEYAMSQIGKTDYCHEPTVWLNGRCWQDEPEAWQRQEGKPAKPKTQMPDDYQGL